MKYGNWMQFLRVIPGSFWLGGVPPSFFSNDARTNRCFCYGACQNGDARKCQGITETWPVPATASHRCGDGCSRHCHTGCIVCDQACSSEWEFACFHDGPGLRWAIWHPTVRGQAPIDRPTRMLPKEMPASFGSVIAPAPALCHSHHHVQDNDSQQHACAHF